MTVFGGENAQTPYPTLFSSKNAGCPRMGIYRLFYIPSNMADNKNPPRFGGNLIAKEC
jgi:hypothetical protein